MQYLAAAPLLTARPAGAADGPGWPAARLDSLVGQVMLDGIFHADPHPGNILLRATAASACWTGARSGGSTPGCAARSSGCCWPRTRRPACSATRCSSGGPPSTSMKPGWKRAGPVPGPLLSRGRHARGGFHRLFRVIADPGLAVPPEIAAVFRALADHGRDADPARPGLRHRGRGPALRPQQLAAQLTRDAIRPRPRPTWPAWAGAAAAAAAASTGSAAPGRRAAHHSVRLRPTRPRPVHDLTGLSGTGTLAFLAAAARDQAVLLRAARWPPCRAVAFISPCRYCHVSRPPRRARPPDHRSAE